MMTEEDMMEMVRFPAISDRLGEVYFLHDNKIVGVGRIASRYMRSVVVNLVDEASIDFFKDDHAVKFFGLENINWVAFRFMDRTGWPEPLYADDPEDRCEGVTIVDKFEFDWGFASKKRYGHIEGFGGEREKERSNEE